MKPHRENLDEYLRLGGNPKIAKQLTIESLQNRSRLSYLLSQLKPVDIIEENAAYPEPVLITPAPPEPVQPPERKRVFTDMIFQYPAELHTAYKKRYEYWLEACSLKLKLNEIPEEDHSAAFDIQEKILKCFDNFDKCQNALDHYNKNKRIMSIDSTQDFTKLSSAELILKRNNLRTNICKRKKTIEKKRENLPDPESPDYNLKLSSLNQKLEELQDLENQESELNKLIK